MSQHPFKIVLFFFLTISLLTGSLWIAPSQVFGDVATYYPNTAASDSSTIAGLIWGSPSRATGVADSVFASNCCAGETDHLKLTNFGFNIPDGSTIDGIVAEVRARQSVGSVNISSYNSVRLYKGGAITGDENASDATWSNALSWDSFGGPGDLWGTVWTASDINSSDFGIGISMLLMQIGPGAPRIDTVRITVHYTEST